MVEYTKKQILSARRMANFAQTVGSFALRTKQPKDLTLQKNVLYGNGFNERQDIIFPTTSAQKMPLCI